MRVQGSAISFLALFLLASGLAACSIFRQQVTEPTATPETVQVTADQIALAMQEDHFFSDYGSENFFVQGVISALNQQGGSTTLVLSTNIATAVDCDLGNYSTTAHIGDTVTVSASAADAQRADSAVVLKNCSIP